MVEESIKIIGNLEIHSDEKFVIVSINPRIYTLDIVYSAAYVFLDRTYIIISGDPNSEIFVELRWQKTGDLETLGRDFNNQLINYAVFKSQSEQGKNIREEIVKKALQTNSIDDTNNDTDDESDDDDYLNDPLDIATPWEEKYKKDE